MARAATAAVRLTTGEREPVRFATTTALTTTLVDGVEKIFGLQSVDSNTPGVGDRVLVKDMANAALNGIYNASEGEWYRAADARTSRSMQKGTTVHVQLGTVNTGRVYAFQTDRPNIGTDNIVLALYMTDSAGQDILDAATQTGLDRIATAADRVQTGIDKAAAAASAATATAKELLTDADATATAADRVQTGLDRVATGNDKIATAADRVQTGIDRAAAEAAAGSVAYTKDNDGTLAANSDDRVSSQKATKTYVDAAIAAIRNGVAAAGDTLIELYNLIANHTGNTSNPHSTTAAQLGLGTGDSPQLAGVNLGHASDTTLTRSAAGVMAVEGNLVPSPASQATNDILVRGASSWGRLAIGAALQVLRVNAAGNGLEYAAGGGGMTVMSPVATTSGSTADITGIAAGAKRITLAFDGVSLSGTDNLLIQLGDSGGVETTGYVSAGGQVYNSAGGAVTSTSGFAIFTNSAAMAANGLITLIHVGSNKWVCEHSLGAAVAFVGGGVKTLSDVLTTVRITRSGTNTLDAGSVTPVVEL